VLALGKGKPKVIRKILKGKKIRKSEMAMLEGVAIIKRGVQSKR
jgi:hypothetical protein